MRNRFDRELELLSSELIEMGSLIESAINDAAGALLRQDGAMARRAAQLHGAIDAMERDIERRCLTLLLQQQPVAADLRLISTALKMVTDMERIGDQAQDISQLALGLIGQSYISDLAHIQPMAQATIQMVTRAINAFIARDLEQARQVVASDDLVDALFVQVRDDLVGLIRQDSANGAQAIDLMMIAKYLERIGDHATNIAEWVIFSITGAHEA